MNSGLNGTIKIGNSNYTINDLLERALAIDNSNLSAFDSKTLSDLNKTIGQITDENGNFTPEAMDFLANRQFTENQWKDLTPDTIRDLGDDYLYTQGGISTLNITKISRRY